MSTLFDGGAPGPLPPPLNPDGRYELRGPLAAGGMGELWRVFDRDLRRPLVMKLVHPSLQAYPELIERFVEEAQVTAQLEHPGVVPVHELGQLDDGRLYFTMTEVRGRTFGEVIAEAHAARGASTLGVPTLSAPALRRLVDLFRRACEAVAYAHARGVLHRDLKPDNLMVGDFGEVLVLDWGLAKVMAEGVGALPPVSSLRGDATRVGAVSGTPAYMPPEQARGEVDRLDPRADVYALGAVLFELLEGRPPFGGVDSHATLDAVLKGPSPTPHATHPVDLRRAVTRAMRRDLEGRFPDAGAFAEELGAWLEGARRRARALALVDEALARRPALRRARRQADALRAQAREAAAALPRLAEDEAKRPVWAIEDAAARADEDAQRQETALLQGLQAALSLEPELREAHDELADHYRARHAEAEAAGSPEALRCAMLLQAHGAERHAAYLRGEGALRLSLQPPEARWRLSRLVSQDRRATPVLHREGAGALRLTLPIGAWLLEASAPGHAPARYPVTIERERSWEGALRLLPEGALGEDEVYVPAGPFRFGGDPEAYFSLPASVEALPDFAITRFPITNRQFIAFLDDLVAQGREAEALRHAPRERSARPELPGELLYGRTEAGGFALAPDAEGDLWDLDWPVIQVDWYGAQAYAAWRAARDGLPWRLPSELEWEKAARGVDGRRWPWGDHLEPTWCCYRGSHRGRPLPAVVDSFPIDCSVYGARGMAGNQRGWCAEVYQRDAVGPQRSDDPDAERVLRGGAFFFTETATRVCSRFGLGPRNRIDSVSFRLARALP